MTRCGLLPHSFHPYPLQGGFVSVALSLGLPPVAVSNCLVLRCPDFPLKRELKRSSSDLTKILYLTGVDLPNALMLAASLFV